MILGCTIGNGLKIAPSTIGVHAGNGLFTTRDFKANEIVTCYEGDYISYLKTMELYQKKQHYYVKPIHALQLYIDGIKEPVEGKGGGSFANDAFGTNFPNNTQYVVIDSHHHLNITNHNHPNVNNGEPLLVLQAIMDISANSEIFVSYGEEYWKLLHHHHNTAHNSNYMSNNSNKLDGEPQKEKINDGDDKMVQVPPASQMNRLEQQKNNGNEQQDQHGKHTILSMKKIHSNSHSNKYNKDDNRIIQLVNNHSSNITAQTISSPQTNDDCQFYHYKSEELACSMLLMLERSFEPHFPNMTHKKNKNYIWHHLSEFGNRLIVLESCDRNKINRKHNPIYGCALYRPVITKDKAFVELIFFFTKKARMGYGTKLMNYLKRCILDQQQQQQPISTIVTFATNEAVDFFAKQQFTLENYDNKWVDLVPFYNGATFMKCSIVSNILNDSAAQTFHRRHQSVSVKTNNTQYQQQQEQQHKQNTTLPTTVSVPNNFIKEKKRKLIEHNDITSMFMKKKINTSNSLPDVVVEDQNNEQSQQVKTSTTTALSSSSETPINAQQKIEKVLEHSKTEADHVSITSISSVTIPKKKPNSTQQRIPPYTVYYYISPIMEAEKYNQLKKAFENKLFQNNVWIPRDEIKNTLGDVFKHHSYWQHIELCRGGSKIVLLEELQNMHGIYLKTHIASECRNSKTYEIFYKSV